MDKMDKMDQRMNDAIKIIYQHHDFDMDDQVTTDFVKTLKDGDRKQDLFSYIFKYAHTSFVRKGKMEYMISYDMTQSSRNLSPIFQKLIKLNKDCIYSASVAFKDAMENYTTFQKVDTVQQTQFNPSWYDRTFGSNAQYAKMVKSVPPIAYLFMVALTFAILQHELIFNAKCVELFQLYETNISVGNPSVVSVPITWHIDDPVFHKTILDAIVKWFKTDHDLSDNLDANVKAFMTAIDMDNVLKMQFRHVINPDLQKKFEAWEQRKAPMSAGRKSVIRRRRTKTNAPKRRKTNKHSRR